MKFKPGDILKYKTKTISNCLFVIKIVSVDRFSKKENEFAAFRKLTKETKYHIVYLNKEKLGMFVNYGANYIDKYYKKVI